MKERLDLENILNFSFLTRLSDEHFEYAIFEF